MFIIHKLIKVNLNADGMITHTYTAGYYACKSEAVKLLTELNCKHLYDDFGLEFWASEVNDRVRYWIEPVEVK